MLTKPQPNVVSLDDVINKLTARLIQEDPATEKYAFIADQLVKLYKLKEIDSKRRVSPDMLVGVGANVFGILSILGYEKFGVITSKAFNILMKAGR
jgi:hypothetical protein